MQVTVIPKTTIWSEPPYDSRLSPDATVPLSGPTVTGSPAAMAGFSVPVKVVVLNNGTLGFVEMEMKASGFLDVGCELKNPNFAAMAEAMGIKGVRVEAPGDLEGALRAALAHDGPALVDVVSARQELAMPPKATIGQALNFNLFLLKAVMDGRAAQIVDLARVNLWI